MDKTSKAGDKIMTTYASWTPIIIIFTIITIEILAFWFIGWHFEKKDRKEHGSIFCGIKDLRLISERLGEKL